MSASVEPLPFDRAWSVLLGACLCMFCGTPAVVFYTFGVFLPEIISDTGWAAASVAAAIGPGALLVALAAPIVGRMSDRWGVRPMAIVGGIAFGAGIALLGVVPQSSGAFIALTMLMYLLAFAATPIVYAHAMTQWFDRRRGMAIGLIFASGALGIAIWPNYAAFLIAAIGWRMAYVVMGMTAGIVILLAGLFLLRSPPRDVAATSYEGVAAGMTVAGALRTGTFWKIALVFTILSAVLGGTAVHFPVLLRQQGADAQGAAAIMSVIGISMLVGRLLLGLLLDRFFAPYLTICIAIVSIAAFALLMSGAGGLVLVLAAGLLGFGLGSEYAEVAYVVSRAFGYRAFGAIYGLVTLATGIGLAVGPAVLGVLLVSGVGTGPIFLAAIVLLVVPIMVLLTIRESDLPFGSAAKGKGEEPAKLLPA